MAWWSKLRIPLGGALLGAAIVLLLATMRARLTDETVLAIAPLASPTSGNVTVFVGGAVRQPGLYTLPQGERIEAALAAAGGLADDADPEGLNRALRLRDEAQIVVPRRGEPTATPPRASPAPGGAASGGAAPVTLASPRPPGTPAPVGPLDVNSASAAELERFPGLGPKLAQAIVEYRAAHGPFAGPAQLAEVKGISERLIATWGDAISYGP